MKRTYIINIDPVNRCPLTCPSCPTGLRLVDAGPLHYLRESELDSILSTITRQANIRILWLFNLNEPFLHPQLPLIVQTGLHYVPYTEVSTTGNFCAFNLADLVAVRPKRITVGISGWTNPVYQTTHTGGDIEKVKKFMVELHDLRAGKMVWICYHRYNNNLHEEAPARRFAKKLGFEFRANWATHINVEKILDGTGNPFLHIPMRDQLALMQKYPNIDCGMWDQLSVTPAGNVKKCTASIDYAHPIGNIFETPLEEIRQRLVDSAFCTECRAKRGQYVVCGPTVEVDRECAKVCKGNQLRYAVERARKHVWVWMVLGRKRAMGRDKKEKA